MLFSAYLPVVQACKCFDYILLTWPVIIWLVEILNEWKNVFSDNNNINEIVDAIKNDKSEEEIHKIVLWKTIDNTSGQRITFCR